MRSIVCNIPPSVELLGPPITSLNTRIHDPQISNQIDAPVTKNRHLSFVHLSIVGQSYRLIRAPAL